MALGNILITAIPTPAGVVSSKYRDGDDSAAVPPSTPQLGQPNVLSSTTVDIPLVAASTGGTAPRVYELERSATSAIAGFSVIDADADFSGDGVYTQTGLAASTQYWWRLACVDADLRRSGYSDVFSATTTAAGGGDVTAPTAPTNLVVTSSVAGQASLTWTNGTDAVGIAFTDVIRGDSLAGVPTNTGAVIDVVTGAGTSYTDYYAPPGSQVFYRIQHRDAAGNVSSQSARYYVTISTASVDYDLYDNFESTSVNTALWLVQTNGGANTAVSTSTDQAYSGTRCKKSVIKWDSTADFRAEVKDKLGPGSIPFLQDIWYGCSIMLHPSWVQSAGRDILHQWHMYDWLQSPPDAGNTSPAVCLQVRNGTWQTQIRFDPAAITTGAAAVDANQTIITHTAGATNHLGPTIPLSPGTWHHFVWRIRWHWTTAGQFEMWHNGVLCVQRNAHGNCSNDTYAPYHKQGNYRVANKSGTPDGTSRIVYHDNFRLVISGGSFAAVDPSTT